MIINHNIAASNTYRQFGAANKAQAGSMEKLSSGQRINKAGDDAAGLAISEKMRGQIRGLDMATKNANDTTSLIQTAEGALNETHSILQRMRELAVQSANDTNTTDDRGEIQKEISQLKNEIDRIGNTTEFNTKKLLDGGVGAKLSSNAAQFGAEGTTTDTKSGVYAVTVTAVATQATIAASADFGANGTAGLIDSANAGTMTINGTDITISANDTIDKVVQKINNQTSSTGVKAIVQEGSTTSTSKIVLQTEEFGSKETISLQFSNSNLSTDLGFGGTVSTSAAGTDVKGTIAGSNAVGEGTTLTLNNSGVDANGLSVEHKATETAATTSFTIGTGVATAFGAETLIINGQSISADLSVDIAHGTYGTDAQKATKLAELINSKKDATGVTATVSNSTITLNSNATGVNAAISVNGTSLDTDGTAGAGKVNFASAAATDAVGNDGMATTDVANITVAKDNILKAQIGANEGQTMEIDINDMRSSALGISNVDVSTQTGASDAIKTLDDAVKKVSAERSKLGAFQNRLDHTINNLGTSSENLSAAESRIRDVDMAKEMMTNTKNSILSQAAQAMLAQANQNPKQVLQLLQ